MISKTYYRYIWLLDTLLNSSPLTIDEINMLWEDCPLSNGPIPLRTFHEQRKGIKEMFGVEIVCDRSHGNVYYVKNPEVLEEKKLVKWLLRNYSIPQDFATFNAMKDRILLEEIPQGQALLNPIIEAMQANTELRIDYQRYEHEREEHLQTFHNFLKDMPVRVELLTGNVKGKRRKAIEEGLLDGSVNILIGTHAVIEDNVQFRSLGLVIIDEQHRFGVAQRAKLWSKSETSPHVLVMTATPIPRTLAMTVYGDLDVSIIDELPPGRKPVRTMHIYDNQPEQLYRGVIREIEAGHQVYFVFPLVKESEKLDLKNVQDEFIHLQEIFPQYRISMVHGKMKPSEKDVEMQKFVSGETQILVATTVIEVGVNVPNASVMIIQNAERFGLSQLHQLRGRVGRGAEQSYCILVSNYKLSAETRKRLQIMTETNDGFEIAEADLRLRGPGDLEGTQQSGIAFNLRLANLGRDGQLVQLARDTASFVLDADPELQARDNTLLRRHLQELRKEHRDWSQIS